MAKITVPQKSLVLEAPVGENLMTFLQAQGLPVASSCLGDGICSMCKMKVTGSLPIPTALEQNTLKRNKGAEGERLSCQITIDADIEVSTKYW